MIPKIIHYCWLSDDPIPESLQKCIDSWRKVMPDYDIRRWDFTRFPKDKSAWVSEAFDRRKYAFAADYIRNYALYTEGGIYLDCDVETLKSFDSLMHLPYFLGYENGSGCVEAAVMASEAGNPIFRKMLEYYEGRHFVKADGSLDMQPLPKVMNEVLSDYKFKLKEHVGDFDYSPDTLTIFPFYFFSPIHIETKRLEQRAETLCIHRFAASWQPKHKLLKRRIKILVGPDITAWLIKTKRRIFGHK